MEPYSYAGLSMDQLNQLNESYLQWLKKKPSQESNLLFLRHLVDLLDGELLEDVWSFILTGEPGQLDLPEVEGGDQDQTIAQSLAEYVGRISEMSPAEYESAEGKEELDILGFFISSLLLVEQEFLGLDEETINQLYSAYADWDDEWEVSWQSSVTFFERICQILAEHPNEKLITEILAIFNHDTGYSVTNLTGILTLLKSEAATDGRIYDSQAFATLFFLGSKIDEIYAEYELNTWAGG